MAINNDKNPTSYLGRFWTDSLVHDEAALLFLIQKIGINRIVLGSDYPFPLGEHYPGKLILESSKLTQEEKYRLLGWNAMELFGSHFKHLPI